MLLSLPAPWRIRVWRRALLFTSAAMPLERQPCGCAMEESPGVARGHTGADGATQTETLLFNVGAAGAKAFQFTLEPLPGERNRPTTPWQRLVNVESDKRRVLYMEGEPRWEYKFIRRAEEDDRIVQLVSMLRTTENKIYRQGIRIPRSWPRVSRPRRGSVRLSGLVIGSVEANYFTPAQQELIREFVDRRGGGLLLLGGRSRSLTAAGACRISPICCRSCFPTKEHIPREPATVELTPAGADSYHRAAGGRSGAKRTSAGRSCRT